MYNSTIETTTVKIIVNVTFARFEKDERINPGHIDEIYEEGLIDSLGDIYDYEENCIVTKPFMMFVFSTFELPTPSHEMKFVTDYLWEFHDVKDFYGDDVEQLKAFAGDHKNGCFAVVYEVKRDDITDYWGEADIDFEWKLLGLLDVTKIGVVT